MKIYYYMRMLIRSIFNQLPLLLITYVLFPFGLAYFMSTSLSSVIEPKIPNPEIDVRIADHDQSSLSKELIDLLHTDKLQSIFVIQKDEEDAEFEITIPEGFEEEFISETPLPLTITGNQSASRSDAQLMAAVFDSVLGDVQRSIRFGTLLDEASLTSEEIENLEENFIAIKNQSLFQDTVFTSEKTLSSQQHFAIAILSYLFILFLSSSVIASDLSESIGYKKRWEAIPLANWKKWLLDLAGDSIQLFFYASGYVVLWLLVGDLRLGNLGLVFLFVFMQSAMVALFLSLITRIFPVFIAKMVVYLMMMITFLFGGILGPILNIMGDGFETFIQNISLTTLIQRPYWSIMQNAPMSEFLHYSSYTILVIGVLVLANLAALTYRKKVVL